MVDWKISGIHGRRSNRPVVNAIDRKDFFPDASGSRLIQVIGPKQFDQAGGKP